MTFHESHRVFRSVHGIAAARGSPPALQAAAEGGASTIPRRARLLIVEDEYFVAVDLEHLLTEAGFEVVGIAGTAEAAVDMAASTEPDLAIMDVRLGGLRDGVEAAIDLMTRFGVRSIFASAHADSRTRQRAEQVKPHGWLQKPYSAEAVVDLVSAALLRDQ